MQKANSEITALMRSHISQTPSGLCDFFTFLCLCVIFQARECRCNISQEITSRFGFPSGSRLSSRWPALNAPQTLNRDAVYSHPSHRCSTDLSPCVLFKVAAVCRSCIMFLLPSCFGSQHFAYGQLSETLWPHIYRHWMRFMFFNVHD